MLSITRADTARRGPFVVDDVRGAADRPAERERYRMNKWWLAGILLLLSAAGPANAQVSVSIGVPSLDIGIHLPAADVDADPRLAGLLRAECRRQLLLLRRHVLGLPERQLVRRAPGTTAPGRSWIRMIVPAYRPPVPVRYYRQAPRLFSRLGADAAPRWAEHWGQHEQNGRAGIKRIALTFRAAAARYRPTNSHTGEPLPASVRSSRPSTTQNYRYQPNEPVVQQHYEQHAAPPQHDHAAREPERGAGHRKSRQQQGDHGCVD